jgi:nitroimidazol reductase NimA-like FMN-containing flavoprotein (pyridoxamine 5'-phosphate oxidase superfamily)
MIGVMTNEEIDATLRRHRVGRIGCSANDRPYVVPITYAYDGEFVYGFSGLGRKIDVMREQPLVCFEVDEIDGDASWRSVIAEGLYEELADGDDRRDALRRLLPTGGQVVPRTLDGTTHYVVFRLRLTERSGRFERRDA